MMSQTHRAEQTNGLAQYPNVTLIAQLVQKYLFTTISKDGKLLTKCGMTFLDLNGRSLDVDVWSSNDWTKAHYLYRKLKANNVYKLTNCSRFIQTDAKFSNSQFRIAQVRKLWIEPHVEESFNPRNYIPCTTSSMDAARLINERGTANIMATYIARHRGPRKFLGENRDSREPVAVGHLVEFEDKNSIRFYVLLWQPKNIKAPYHLFGAEPGEIMLIPNCRSFTRPLETSNYVLDPKAAHFTTLCHAVSNSLAVAPEKFRELRRRPAPTKRDDNTNDRPSLAQVGGDNNRGERRSRKTNARKN